MAAKIIGHHMPAHPALDQDGKPAEGVRRAQAVAVERSRLDRTLVRTVRAGFSLETGGAFDQDLPVNETLLKHSASVFLSDTRFGPAFFGAGNTKGGGNKLYLFLGPIFW